MINWSLEGVIVSSNKDSVSEFLQPFQITLLLAEFWNKHYKAIDSRLLVKDSFPGHYNPLLGPRACYWGKACEAFHLQEFSTSSGYILEQLKSQQLLHPLGLSWSSKSHMMPPKMNSQSLYSVLLSLCPPHIYWK